MDVVNPVVLQELHHVRFALRSSSAKHEKRRAKEGRHGRMFLLALTEFLRPNFQS